MFFSCSWHIIEILVYFQSIVFNVYQIYLALCEKDFSIKNSISFCCSCLAFKLCIQGMWSIQPQEQTATTFTKFSCKHKYWENSDLCSFVRFSENLLDQRQIYVSTYYIIKLLYYCLCYYIIVWVMFLFLQLTQVTNRYSSHWKSFNIWNLRNYSFVRCITLRPENSIF